MGKLCLVCNQDWDWHQAHKPRHKFITEEDLESIQVEEPPKIEVSRAGDPALRMALIHAGVLTEQDLTQALEWINAAREHGKALVMLPDEEGKMQYHLADLNEAMVLKAGR